MNKLDKLAIKYGTDKFGDKHKYTPYYYNLFKNRQKTVKKVLEIGAGEGASLRMWRDFFPNAMIYSGDNNLKRLYVENRIKTFYCDQSNIKDLERLIALTGFDIDLFIDDGTHKPEDQINTCLTVMPLLKKNAIYIIEDVVDLIVLEKLTKAKFDCRMIGFSTNRYDDRLIIVRYK